MRRLQRYHVDAVGQTQFRRRAHLLTSHAHIPDVHTRKQWLHSVQRGHEPQKVWVPRHGLPACQDLEQDAAHDGSGQIACAANDNRQTCITTKGDLTNSNFHPQELWRLSQYVRAQDALTVRKRLQPCRTCSIVMCNTRLTFGRVLGRIMQGFSCCQAPTEPLWHGCI